MPQTYDAIIVGAGPAGSALAIHLATRGLEVLLVDKSRFPRDKVCGEMLNPRALKHLDELGCLEPIADGGFTRLRKCSMVVDGEVVSQSYLPDLPGYVDYSCAVPRHLLDTWIFDRARELGSETLEDCRVMRISVKITTGSGRKLPRIRSAATLVV